MWSGMMLGGWGCEYAWKRLCGMGCVGGLGMECSGGGIEKEGYGRVVEMKIGGRRSRG